jgi:hypothetical protein
MKVLMFLVLLVVPGAGAASPKTPIELMNPADIADIEKLDRKVDRLIAKVRQCEAAGLAPSSQCICYYPGKFASAKSLYHSVLEKHPEWEGRAVLWWDNTRSYPSNIHLGGLRNQFEQSCSQAS